MHTRTRTAVLLVIVAGVLAVSGAVVGSASNMYTVDDDHDLVEPEKIDEYEATGSATAHVAAPDLTITVAEESDDVGLDGWRMDSDSRYLRIQYHEEVPRTIRVFIPSEYWHPVTHQTDSIEETHTAEMRPTEGGRHTAVTVDFDGEADVVFELPKATNFVFWTREESRDVVNETVGYEPPRLSTGGEWDYIPPEEFESNDTVSIDDSEGSTIQYDASSEDEDERWVSVPRCSRSSIDVCTYSVDGKDDVVMVLSTTEDPPQVRFKTGADPIEEAKAGWRDFWSTPGDFWDDVTGFWGDDDE